MATPQSPPPLASTTITSHDGVVTCMHLAPNHIIVALDNGRINIFDKEGRNERVIKASEGGIWALCSWEEDWIVCGGLEGLMSVWDLESLEHKQSLIGHTSTVRWIKALSPTTLVSGSRDTTIRLWNLSTGQCTAKFEGHTSTISSLAAQGDTLVSASYDDARIWSLEKGECIHILKGHTEPIYDVAYDGKRIVTGSGDCTARVWDSMSGECLAVLKNDGLIGNLQLCPEVVITGDNVGVVRVWSLDDYSQVLSFEAHDGHAVTSMFFDGSKIVTGGTDGNVRVWDLRSGKLVKELAKSDAVWKVGFLNEKAVAVFSREKEVILEVWDSETLN